MTSIDESDALMTTVKPAAACPSPKALVETLVEVIRELRRLMMKNALKADAYTALASKSSRKQYELLKKERGQLNQTLEDLHVRVMRTCATAGEALDKVLTVLEAKPPRLSSEDHKWAVSVVSDFYYNPEGISGCGVWRFDEFYRHYSGGVEGPVKTRVIDLVG